MMCSPPEKTSAFKIMKIIKFNENFYFNIDEIFVLKKSVVDNPDAKEWIKNCNAIIAEVKNINEGKLPEISLEFNTIYSPDIYYSNIGDDEKVKLNEEYSHKFVDEFVVPKIGPIPEDKKTKYEIIFKNGHHIDLEEDFYNVIKKELDKIVINNE